jgi:replicative DNA helicase
MDAHESGHSPGLALPWRSLGSMLSPEPGDLVIIAGRPAMGKSAAVQMMSDYHSMQGIGVFEANLEMPRAQSFMRRLAPRAGVPFMDLRKGTLSRDQFARVTQTSFEMEQEPYWIDDTPGQTVDAIRRKARRLKRANPNLGVMAVDYLTLCHPPAYLRKGNRSEQVGYMAQAFKDAAKELDIVVYLLAQLNREVDKRQDKHPVMGDLRESGGIEQAADTIVFVMRPGYYDESDTSGDVDFDIAKQRNGKTGRVPLRWTPETTWFADKPAPPWRPHGQ